MAFFPVGAPCNQCRESIGISICGGCNRLFCQKHSVEHRQELAEQLNEVEKEHDLLQQDFELTNKKILILSRINTWEEDSIETIKLTAEKARNDLRELVFRDVEELEKPFDELTSELQSSQQFDDYTERDLLRWMKQIQKLHKKIQQSSAISITNNDEKYVIRLIKIYDPSSKDISTENGKDEKLRLNDQEKFGEVVGEGEILLNGLIANCPNYSVDPPCLFSGINEYSTGTHHIEFLIRWRGAAAQFFGIIPSSEEINANVVTAPFTFGWWGFEQPVKNGQSSHYIEHDKSFITGDQLVLILDCNNRKILLSNYGTNQQAVVEVDLQVCPLPWRMIALLNWESDCVQILYR